MRSTDETALFCDLAETYNVFGFDSLPIEQVAMLAAGLREDSRIKQKMSGLSFAPKQLILSHLADTASSVLYTLTRGGIGEPYMFMEHIKESKQKESEGFNTGQEFLDFWRKNVMEG